MRIKCYRYAKDFFFYGQTRREVEAFLDESSRVVRFAKSKVSKLLKEEAQGGGITQRILKSSWKATVYFSSLGKRERFCSSEKVRGAYQRFAIGTKVKGSTAKL